MSRVAKLPIAIPKGVEIKLQAKSICVKGPKGELEQAIHAQVNIEQSANSLQVSPVNSEKISKALAGTIRALVANMVTGVTEGFVRKLSLVGVGYRAQAKGEKLNLTLGFSHPVELSIPAGISVQTPSQTEIHVTGPNKQVVGQVAAMIRSIRPPEPYKGKGVRYFDEHVVRKEAKKK